MFLNDIIHMPTKLFQQKLLEPETYATKTLNIKIFNKI
jgi:hypothetical protein